MDETRSKGWLKKFLDWLLRMVAEEWDALFVIVALSVLATTVLLEPNADRAAARWWVIWACPILIFLTVLFVRIRGTIRDQASSVTRLEQGSAALYDELSSLVRAIQTEPFLREERAFSADFLVDARDVDMLGITLERSVGDNIKSLVDALSRGHTVRVVITDPTPQMVAEFPKRFLEGGAGERRYTLQGRIDRTEDVIDDVVAKATERGATGELWLGRLPFITPCGIIVVGREGGLRDLRCEIYHRASTSNQSAFYLSSTGPNPSPQNMAVFEQTFAAYYKLADAKKRYPAASPDEVTA